LEGQHPGQQQQQQRKGQMNKKIISPSANGPINLANPIILAVASLIAPLRLPPVIFLIRSLLNYARITL